jgi:hypothetical protein
MARTKLDHALIAVKAGLNLIPFVGGSLASLVEYIPSIPSVTISYPWLETNFWLLGENKEVKEIRLHIGVRDEPAAPEAKKGVLTVSSLQNLHLEVSMPVAVNATAGGWHSCMVGCVNAVEWNNYVSTLNPIGIIELKNEITVLEIRGSSSNAIWNGTVVLHRKGDHVDWEKSLGGWVKTPQGQQSVLVGETSQNRVKTHTKGKPIHLTPDLLIQYGIPVKANGNIANACEAPAQSPLPTPPH